MDRKSKSPTAGFWTVTLVLLGFCLVLKLSSWDFPHNRGDEPIYWQLSENIARHGQYNLAGAPILKKLSPHAYDRKLFHHPPLYPVLLIPFVLAGSMTSAVVVSWLGHALCVIAVAWIVRSALRKGAGGFDALSPLFWVPVLGVAADPFLTFMSTKLWTDGLLAGLVALSLSLFVLAEDSNRPVRLLLAAGAILGLAALTKLVAVLALPVAAAILWLQSKGNAKSFAKSAAVGFAPVILLVLPWLIIFYRAYGELTPSWIRPDEWTLQHIPFVAAAAQRPVSYYLIKTGMIQPLFFAGLGFAFNRTVLGNYFYRVGLIWCLVFLAAMTALSVNGVFQMRYLAPLYPGIYVMAAGLLQCAHRHLPAMVLAMLLCITYAAVGGALYLLNPDYHEMYSLLEWGHWVSFEP